MGCHRVRSWVGGGSYGLGLSGCHRVGVLGCWGVLGWGAWDWWGVIGLGSGFGGGLRVRGLGLVGCHRVGV